MALDRQKILNELGSVMNQLKSTDCGCLGKVFGDSGRNVGQTGCASTCGGYRQGCCHGHHYDCSSTPNNLQNSHRSCMGQCNPPKLYSDTYNYLKENLMQPTINEVYNDLKDITPANTIMNNPMTNQMGFSNGLEKQNIGANLNTGNHPSPNNICTNNMGQFGRMGPQIVNMFGESNTSKAGNMVQQTNPNSNQFDYIKEKSSYVTQSQYSSPFEFKQQSEEYPQQISNMNKNAALNPKMTPNNHHNHGQHTQGIAKFNEMFPGVMKNGDLGFDAMAIAIQMNPANQKQVAVDTIHKMINNNNNVSPSTKPNDNATELHNRYGTHPKHIYDNILPNEILQSNIPNQQASPQMVLQQQPVVATAQLNNQPIKPYQPVSQPPNPHGIYPGLSSQNGYSAPSTPINQQQILYHQQPITDQNTGNAIAQLNLPMIYEGSSVPKNLQSIPENPNTEQIIKEPLLPVDTSKLETPNQKYYNTLGQPIEMLPARMYHTPEPGLPQTLSPQLATTPRSDFMKYSNVKSTVSKTSLMGNKPIGKTSSRNQLQQIYNQYKGSQSFTNQNIREQLRRDTSHSEGKLNVPHVNLTSNQLPIESVGGDTTANNRFNEERIHKTEHVLGQIGDAPIVKLTGNLSETLSPASNRKCRNGLQDIVYTSYPTSAAWSFHGHGRAIPFAGYTYRKKI